MSTAVRADPLSPAETRAVDETLHAWMVRTEAPSVSVTIVRDGAIVYVRALGDARLASRVPATPATRYSIASVSKQFAGAAILRLADEGKLALSDNIATHLPELARPEAVTIRDILSHTSGYPELYELDYATPRVQAPVHFESGLADWAKKPLDFAPGTEWRYSNTGIDIAGVIVERATGLPYIDALRREVFTPLGITDAAQRNPDALTPRDAYGYTRYAAGPARHAPSPGFGWNFAGGGLVMTPSDLARWDIGLMDGHFLSATSYAALTTPVLTKDGHDTHYSMGFGVYESDGRLNLQHGGDGFGFTAENMLWPAERTAIAVCTNNEWTPSLTGLRDDLVARIAFIVMPPTPTEARARNVFDGFRRGMIDRSLFGEEGNRFFSADVLADQKKGLARFGPARAFLLRNRSTEGGLIHSNWTILTDREPLYALEIDTPDGQIDEFLIATMHN